MTKIKTKNSLIHIFLTKMTKKLLKDFKELHKSVLLCELVNSIEISKTKKNIIVDCTL